jgi:hypothetical protein
VVATLALAAFGDPSNVMAIGTIGFAALSSGSGHEARN